MDIATELGIHDRDEEILRLRYFLRRWINMKMLDETDQLMLESRDMLDYWEGA